MESIKDMYEGFLGHEVILDTIGPIIYIGFLKDVHEYFVDMIDVDVHDVNDSFSNKEHYLLKVKEFGIRPNRNKCRIDREKVLSISLFNDLILFK